MIIVVTRWEATQLSPLEEWQLWRQMRGAFGITRFKFVPVMDEMKQVDVDQYATMEEALASLDPNMPKAFLEPSGDKTMGELPQDDLVLICGNTDNNNTWHAGADEMYCINTNGLTRHNHLYAPNAVAIALAIRLGQ